MYLRQGAALPWPESRHKKTSPPAGSAAGGPGTIWFCDGLHRLTACLPGVTVFGLRVSIRMLRYQLFKCIITWVACQPPDITASIGADTFAVLAGLAMAEPAAAINHTAPGAPPGRAEARTLFTTD